MSEISYTTYIRLNRNSDKTEINLKIMQFFNNCIRINPEIRIILIHETKCWFLHAAFASISLILEKVLFRNHKIG